MGARRSEITNLPLITLEDPKKVISIIELENQAQSFLNTLLSSEEKNLIQNVTYK